MTQCFSLLEGKSIVMNSRYLEVTGLKKHYSIRTDLLARLTGKTAVLKAVDGIDFYIKRGETLGLVGESGCGKSTTARLVARLLEPTAGSAYIEGKNIFTLKRAEVHQLRRTVQFVFQDPYSSLNPRKTIMQILSRPLEVHKLAYSFLQKRHRVSELLTMVGLGAEHVDRYPHEFSGGQRQRIAIARALAVTPQLVIADEPVSALDVSIQAQILNLFRQLQEELHLTYLFIAHDLSVIRHISNRVAVMYVGKIVETGTVQQIFEAPMHPYTQALLAAVPVPNPMAPPPRLTLSGEVPSPINPPVGCRLYGRCPLASSECAEIDPELRDRGNEHFVSCHNV
jgi:oligopeptide transport system ATP-binding protein